MRAAAQLMGARSLSYGVDAVIATGRAWHAVGDVRLSSFNTSPCSKLAARTAALLPALRARPPGVIDAVHYLDLNVN